MISIALISISTAAAIALVPVLAQINKMYPDYERWSQLLLTFPALFLVFSAPLTRGMMKRFSGKGVTIVSVSIIFFAGISPYWIEGFGYLLFSRALLGIGLGFLNTVLSSLPALYFEDDSLRNLAAGIQAAFISGGGILFNFLSGTLALGTWKRVFLVHFIHVIPLFIAIVIMPAVPKAEEEPEIKRETKSAGFAGSSIAALSFFCFLLLATFPLNLSVFTDQRGLGNSQFVGMLASFNSVWGFIIGLLFSNIYKKLKHYTLPTGLLVTALGLFTVVLCGNSWILLVGSFLFGIGTSLIAPSFNVKIYEQVPKKQVVTAIALFNMGSNLAQFASPFVINTLAKIVALNKQQEARFFLAASLLVVVAFLLGFSENRKNSPRDNP